MSILAASPATTQPTGAIAALLATLILLAPALGIAFWVGVFRRRSINGPVRLPDTEPVWPLLVITCLGGAVWLMSQAGYGAVAAACSG